MNLIIITISSYTYITFAVPKEKEVTRIEKSVEKNVNMDMIKNIVRLL